MDAAFKWIGLFAEGEYFIGQADGRTTNTTLRAQGFTTEDLSAAEFRALVSSETARWKPVIEAAGLVGQQ